MHPLLNESGDFIFEKWSKTRIGTRGLNTSLSERTVDAYRSIWNAWLQHLAQSGTAWAQATPEQLDAFSRSRQQRARPKATAAARTSPVTVRRYFEVVRSVYAALPTLALPLDGEPLPVHAIARLEPPLDTPNRMESTVLPGPALRHLAQALEQPLSSDDWVVLRDRVILALLLDTACTLAELQSLRLDDCVRSPSSGRVHIKVLSQVNQTATSAPSGDASERSSPSNDEHDDESSALRQRKKAPTERTQRALPRRHAQRNLDLSPSTVVWLERWLSVRSQLGSTTDFLFIGAKDKGPLTAPTLWRATSTELRRCYQAMGQATPYHVGPAVLRNSVMLAWLLHGVDIAEVARRAGLKSVRSLERLVKLANDDVRAAYALSVSSSAAPN